MADEQVDGLVIASRFDESGLDRSVQAELAALQQFVNSVGSLADRIPPLDLEVGPFAQAIADAGGDVRGFFAGLREGIQEGITEAQALGEAIRAVPPAPTVQPPPQAPSTDITTQLRVEQATAISLSRALAEVGAATRELSTIPPVTLDTRNAVNAAGTLIERLGLTSRAVQTVQQALSGASLGPPTGLREVIGILEPIPATAQEAAAALAQLGAALNTAGQQATVLSAATRQTLTFTQQIAEAARQAATGLTLEAEAAQAAARANAAVQAAGGGSALAAAAGENARANVLAGAFQQTRREAVSMSEGFAIATRNLAVLAAAQDQVRTGTGRLAGGFAVAAADAKALAAAEAAAGKAGVTVGRGIPEGARQATRALAGLAASAIGVTGPLGQLAQAGLLFAGGSALVAGGAAAVLIGVKAWEIFTAGQREAAKATDENREALKRLQEQQKGPVRQARESFDLQKQEVDRLNQALTDLAVRQREAATVPAGRSGVASLAAQNDLLRERQRLLTELKDAVGLLATAQIALGAAGATELGERNRELADALQLGLATTKERQEAVTQLGVLAARERDATVPLKDRIAAARDYNALLDSTLQTTEQVVAADQRSAQAALQRFQQLRQQAAGLGADVSVKLDVADAEDALRRFQGTIAADLAEVNRLRAGLDANSAAAQRLADKSVALTGLRDAIAQIITSAKPTGLQALVESVDSVGRRLAALKAIQDGSASSQRAIAQTAAQAAFQYAALAAEIERAGGAAQADTRLLDAQAQAFRNLGEGTGALVIGLASASAQLKAARTDAAQFGDTLGALPEDTLIRMTLDTGPATVSLQEFQARTAQDVAILAELRLRLGAAQEQLTAFQASAQQDAAVGVDLTADVTRAQAALDAFRQDVSQRQAVIPVSADVADAEAQVGAFFRELVRRQQEQARLQLGNIELPKIGDEIPRAFEQAQGAVDGLNDALTEAASESNKFFRQAADGADDLNDGVRDVTRGVDQLARAAVGIGAIGEQAARSIGSVLDLADALDAIAKNASFGNILGGISAGIGVIGSLFGSSATSQEHDRILAENNARLRELSVDLRNTQGTGAAATAQDLARALAASGIVKEFAGSPIDIIRNVSTPELNQQLHEAGLSLAEFDRIVKDTTGLEILDSKGHLIGETLGQANQALQRYLEAQTRFTDTLDEQTRRATLKARLEGQDQDIRATFAREVDVTGQFSDVIKQAFGSVDLGNDAQVRAAAVDLFNRFAAGQITPEELGISKEDFLAFLDDAAGFLDSFNSGLGSATSALIDIPKGFRQARLEFEAQNPTPPPSSTVRVTEFSPRIPGGTDGSQLPALVAAVHNILAEPRQNIERVVIQMDARGKDTDTLVAELRRKLRDLGVAETGNPDQFLDSGA